MRTGTGIEIKDYDLTHEFKFAGKKVLIGKFDPSSYPEMSERRLTDLQQDIYDQIEDSQIFNEKEQNKICLLSSREFNSCISIRKK